MLWRRVEGMPHAAISAVFIPIGGGTLPGASIAQQDAEDEADFESSSSSGPGAMPAAPVGASSSASASAASGISASPVQAIVVTNFHAYWNPRWPELKVLQVALVTQATNRIRLAVNSKLGRNDGAVLLCGDLNTMPLLRGPTEADPSPGHGREWPLAPGVYELLTSGHLPAEHPHHPFARRKGALYKSDVPPLHPSSVPPITLPLRFASAYATVTGAEPAWTNWHTHDFVECLDYIFVATHERDSVTSASVGSSDSPLSPAWRPLTGAPMPFAVLQPPSEADILALPGGKAGGCPNEAVPSDHIPIAAKLRFPAP